MIRETKMTKETKELVSLGKSLLNKGIAIQKVEAILKSRANSKRHYEEISFELFNRQKETSRRVFSPQEMPKLLSAQRVKKAYELRLKNCLVAPVLIILMGFIVWGLSDEELNWNAPFGYFTIVQGLILLGLFAFIRQERLNNLLVMVGGLFSVMWIIEIIAIGIPNDLYEVLYDPSYRFAQTGSSVRSGITRTFGFIFPFLYVVTKVIFAIVLFLPYFAFKKYDELDVQLKKDIELLK